MRWKLKRRPAVTALPPEAWHALTLDAVFDRLDSGAVGLSAEAARQRLARHGPNRLRPPKRRGPVLRFLGQFHNLLIYVLLVAGAVTMLLEHWVDAGVIFGVVAINAVIGFIQEGKAEHALEAIRGLLSLRATVLRDGRRATVDAENLVPGDVVLVQSGDRVPADLRLSRVKNLQIQEAMLTGESLPVEKSVEPVAAAAPLGDRASLAYSGTLVTYGQGAGVVVATGDSTEIGRISAMLAEVQTLTTPLLRRMAEFARYLTAAIITIAATTFGFGVLVRDYAASDMFLAAVGLAVAAIPEGLPAIMTIALAIGVQRMARRNAIVRRLPAVETLGSVDVIFSDKTGTLTRNEMMVQSVATSRDLFDVTGDGYQPSGEILMGGAPASADDRALLAEIARGAMLCSDAAVVETAGTWTVEGDPMEGALVVFARKVGLETEFESKACPRTDVIPFESEHRFMATLHHDHAGRGFVFVKGAPERILEMCAGQRGRAGDEPLNQAYWSARVEEMAARGQRILALAMRQAAAGQAVLRFEDVQQRLTLVGLFGLADAPRPEAIDAVARCHTAGIGVKMITGDHAGTALAVARQLGLRNVGEALRGPQLDALDDAGLAEAGLRNDVFARASPAHKLRLVEAMQAHGYVVAMTGDGVNDAPALKRADVGVAMGRKGTEAAKEAAEMVLADDNFASIAFAVEEGRTVYDNIKKAIMFILPTNGGEALTIIAAIASGRLLPITPVQILWVNMITAVTLALALAFEPAEPHIMSRPPRRAAEPLLSGFLVWRIASVSLIMLAGTFGLFLWAREGGADIETARTIAVNTLVMFEVFYLLNTRSILTPALSRASLAGGRPVLTAIVLVLGFQLLFTYAPPLQHLFATRAVGADWWLALTVAAAGLFLLVEAEKWLLRVVGARRHR